MSWFVGVDVGGTFTDFYAFDEASGASLVFKTPSTPDNPARAIAEGLQAMCRGCDIPLEAIGRLAHGTTVATNALIQRRGGTVALITTAGFRDLLEIGRQTRPHMYNMIEDNPEPLVPREWRFQLPERVLADGSVRTALTPDAVRRTVEQVCASGAQACAVSLLFSFVNPDHERQIGEALRTAAESLYVSISSEVQPEFREYERLSTTVLNAYLQPVMESYLGDLGARLKPILAGVEIGINQSSGGLMSIQRARRFPVRAALSGPAAGAVGAVHVARLAGRPNVITLDMGGTSADVALVKDYATSMGFDREVGGFPVRLPMLDINTIGAGGGSIAWFDRDGALKVGPISAGADPGPACYGTGGDRPTITDANLLLGRLSPRGLLGGQMELDYDAARRVYEPVAERLGFTPERAAHGVLAIVVSNMVRAIRAVSIERGHDARRFTLMPFGGAGPLHATDVARALGIREILVPPAPGILCAQGLVVSDLKEDFVRTHRMLLAHEQRHAMQARVDELLSEAAQWFAAERVAAVDRGLELKLDMRYVGQNFELAVALGDTHLPPLDELRQMFFQAHEMSYGYFNAYDPIEIVNFRLTARGRLPRPSEHVGELVEQAAPTVPDSRSVWFGHDASIETRVYDRGQLLPGKVLHGPCVIEQLDATTLLYPGDTLAVDSSLNLLIELAP